MISLRLAEFKDQAIVRYLKDTVIDRMEASLAREIGTASQAIQDGEPVPFDSWPDTLRAKALYVARVAIRMLDTKANKHAELHCREALSQLRHGCDFTALATGQQNAIRLEVRCVIDRWYGRMSDRNFIWLGADRAAALSPETRVQ